MAKREVPPAPSIRYDYIIDRCKDFITLINRDHVYELANESYCQAIGKSRSEIVGASVADVWGRDVYDSTLKGYLDRCLEGQPVSYIQRFRFGTDLRYVQVEYYPYGESDGAATHALVFSRDFTRLGDLENRIVNYEYRDPLTGLFNRRSLEMVLDMELLRADQDVDDPLRALLFIGIENLSDINRTFGHSIGAFLLENTGMRIKEMVRNRDRVFHFQENEFAVLLSHLAVVTDVVKVARKIADAVAAPYRHQERDITLSCNIDIAVYPDDASDRESLVARAISALNEAVRTRSEYTLYDSSIQQRAAERISVESQLRNAFQNGQFELYFQPIMKIGGGPEGAEALIRWHRTDNGVIPPQSFIPLANEIGVMKPLSRWVIFNATRGLAGLTKNPDFYVTVNLTASDLADPELPGLLRSALQQAGNLDPSRLKVEITESESMAEQDKAIPRINEIQAMGIEVYIDDFGIGQSSLSYLKDLPASTVKIDRSFVEALAEHPEDISFLDHVVHLVKLRGKRVIAEGVETEKALGLLKTIGCDAVQGFLYSRPLTGEEFRKLYGSE